MISANIANYLKLLYTVLPPSGGYKILQHEDGRKWGQKETKAKLHDLCPTLCIMKNIVLLVIPIRYIDLEQN